MSTSPALAAFQSTCHEHYTCYVFASSGMEKVAAGLALDAERYPDQKIFIGNGRPDKVPAQSVIFARRAVGASQRDGAFQDTLGKALLTLIYAEWDEYFRHEIAREHSTSAEHISSPLMGEVRLVRQWIAHKKSIVQVNVSKLHVLPWKLEVGQKLLVTSAMFRELIDSVNCMAVEIKNVGSKHGT